MAPLRSYTQRPRNRRQRHLEASVSDGKGKINVRGWGRQKDLTKDKTSATPVRRSLGVEKQTEADRLGPTTRLEIHVRLRPSPRAGVKTNAPGVTGGNTTFSLAQRTRAWPTTFTLPWLSVPWTLPREIEGVYPTPFLVSHCEAHWLRT